MASIHLRNVDVDFPLYSGASRSLKTSLLHLGSGGRIGRTVSDRMCVQALTNLDFRYIRSANSTCNLPSLDFALFENISNTSKMISILNNLKIIQDVERLEKRKKRTGKVALRGRTSKIGKSVIFVVGNTEKISKACSGIPGVETCSVNDLSVLNLAPGGSLIRLTVFSKNALKEISQIKSTHLELMVTLK